MIDLIEQANRFKGGFNSSKLGDDEDIAQIEFANSIVGKYIFIFENEITKERWCEHRVSLWYMPEELAKNSKCVDVLQYKFAF